jgi:hypothetical protein
LSGPLYFRYSGLTIESGVDIHDLAPFAVPPLPQPDIRIESAVFSPKLPSNDKVINSGREVWLVVPDVIVFKIADGKTIIVYSLPGVPPRQWQPFLLGSAWNALCLQRGLLMLHAAVVGGSHGAYAISGPSGAGKSTTAAQLTSYGMSLLSDDLCRVEPRLAEPFVYPSVPRMRLWGETVRALGIDPSGLPRVLDGRDKYLVQSASTPIAEPLPLRGIFLLEWGKPEVIRIRGLQALSYLVRNSTYRPRIIQQMGMEATHWEQCLRLLHAVPLYVFRRSKNSGLVNSASDLMSFLTSDCMDEAH